MNVSGVVPAQWRTDYPNKSSGSPSPWANYNFEAQPIAYMDAVLKTVRPYFQAQGNRLVATGTEPWWISEWMDYDVFGREPFMGLTKERGPLLHDLSPTSAKGSQVWAVNFYNETGAATFHQVFADPCSPLVPGKVLFAEGTVAIKFLFTDANLGQFGGQVSYLDGGPTYKAWVDKEGVGSPPISPGQRVPRDLQLLQLDLSIKDYRAGKTGWVFGTYAWIGPKTGDGLFDNLIPVALIWANDEGVLTNQIKESWINPLLRGKLYGWIERPYLGFLGRANGPADNVISSCLSCHATARLPRSTSGYVDRNFNFNLDVNDPVKVKAHVDVWFKNIQSGDVFDATHPPLVVATLDYSLQLNSAIERMCLVCTKGDLAGKTPAICVNSNLYVQPTCGTAAPASAELSDEMIEDKLPPRQ